MQYGTDLSNQHVSDTVRAVHFCHPLGRVPVLLMDVHENSLLCLPSCHKLLLCFIKLALVFEIEGVFEVNVR